MGPEVIVVVSPTLRKLAHKSSWAQRWNRLQHCPFKICSTCSCRVRREPTGLHVPLFIGCSFPVSLGSCTDLPAAGVASAAHRTVVAEVCQTLATRLSADRPVGLLPEMGPDLATGTVSSDVQLPSVRPVGLPPPIWVRTLGTQQALNSPPPVNARAAPWLHTPWTYRRSRVAKTVRSKRRGNRPTQLHLKNKSEIVATLSKLKA